MVNKEHIWLRLLVSLAETYTHRLSLRLSLHLLPSRGLKRQHFLCKTENDFQQCTHDFAVHARPPGRRFLKEHPMHKTFRADLFPV